MTLIKRVGGYLAEITISEALEIVTCHWGRWVSEEDVTISKQTFRVELYPLRRPSGQQFCNMVMLFFLNLPLRIPSGQQFGTWLWFFFNIFSKTPFSQEYVIISPRWVGGKLTNT